jgi:hypothetical protein
VPTNSDAALRRVRGRRDRRREFVGPVAMHVAGDDDRVCDLAIAPKWRAGGGARIRNRPICPCSGRSRGRPVRSMRAIGTCCASAFHAAATARARRRAIRAAARPGSCLRDRAARGAAAGGSPCELVGAVLARVEHMERGEPPELEPAIEQQVGPARQRGAPQRHVFEIRLIPGRAAAQEIRGRDPVRMLRDRAA